MIILPAIDLKDGRCVRLVEGRLGTERVVAEDAVAQAKLFEAAGARRIHVVDLDGAFSGRSKNRALIERIAAGVSVPLQIGGGLRSAEDVRAALSVAGFAIVGTMAVTDPDLFAEVCGVNPGRIIAGVDQKGGKVATDGWVSASEQSTIDVARRAEHAGAAAVVTTDIARDGTGHGVDVTGTAALAEALSIPVIASGGVASLDDVRALAKTSVFGVVIGRAIYDGAVDLEEACRIAASSRAST